MAFQKFTQAEAWKPLTAEEVLVDPQKARERLAARESLKVLSPEPKKA